MGYDTSLFAGLWIQHNTESFCAWVPSILQGRRFLRVRHKGAEKRARGLTASVMHLLHLIFSAQAEVGASPLALKNSSGSHLVYWHWNASLMWTVRSGYPLKSVHIISGCLGLSELERCEGLHRPWGAIPSLLVGTGIWCPEAVDYTSFFFSNFRLEWPLSAPAQGFMKTSLRLI